MSVAEDVVGALLATGVSIRGDVGEPGLKGDKGDRGKDGPKGKDGRDGTDGKDGVGPDEKVKLNASDPEAGFLDDKLEAGRGVYLIKKRGSQGDKLVIEAPGTGMVGAISGGAGPAGPPGQGVPTGGTTGQVLAKASNANFDDEWVNQTGGSGLPSGGTVGQVVTNTGPGTGAWDDVSGLPPQWTDGGNGNVTATVDDVTKTAVTINALVGQGASAPMLRVNDENLRRLFTVNQEAGAPGATVSFGPLGGSGGPSQAFELDRVAGVFTEAFWRLLVGTGGFTLDSFIDVVDATQSYTTATIQGQTSQTGPLLVLQNAAQDPLFKVGAAGEIFVTVPTSDPAVAGQLWNNLGVLMVSAG